MKQCQKCGFENVDEAHYCAGCGNSLQGTRYEIVPADRIRELNNEIRRLEDDYIYNPKISTGLKVLRVAVKDRWNAVKDRWDRDLFLSILILIPILVIALPIIKHEIEVEINGCEKYHIAAESGQYALFKKDRQLTPYQYDTIIFRTDHKILTHIFAMNNGKYGRLDNKGQIVNSCIYDCIYDFSEGWAVTKRGDLYGFIKEESGEVIKPKYKNAYGFSDGFALVQFTDNTFGWIDGKTGEPVSWGGVYQAGHYRNGFAWISIERPTGNREYGYVDTRGYITNLHATNVCEFNNGRAFFSKGAGYAMIDKSLTLLTDFVIQPWIDPSTKKKSFPYVIRKGWKCYYKGTECYVNRRGKITPIESALD